ncbi:MAG: hypothetical protein AB7P00_36555, partial [Sandaracinaceae bacterium]
MAASLGPPFGLRFVVRIALILPFGEPHEGFFDDTVLALMATEARRRRHEARLVRVYYDGRDPTRDQAVRERLRGWLDELDPELVVLERHFDPAPLEGRRVVQVTRGDSVESTEGVALVLGRSAGITARDTTRTPGPGGLVLAFARLLDALVAGADPLDVPGVSSPDDPARTPLEPARLPDPFDPVLEHETIALGPPPAVTIKTIYGNLGCPYSRDPMEREAFRGVRLPTVPMARLGCSFCSMGGDYEKRPDAEVVAEVVRQADHYARSLQSLEALLLNDQHALRYLAALMREAAHIRPMRWLFAARADAVLREQDKLRAAIDAARASGHRIELYLSGFEAFSDAALERFNKGVSRDELVRAVHVMRALHRESGGTFEHARAKGHSAILWTPWTTRDELRESARTMREHGLMELFDEVGKNRLRLHADLPITYLADRDGALVDAWEPGDEGAAREKGYNVELPWRFLDPEGGTAFRVARELRESLGTETELAQLLAVAEAPPPAPERVAADLARLAAAFDRLLAKDRGDAMPDRGRRARASVVSLTGACNNGCPACANRDVFLDDAKDAVATRIAAACEGDRPIVLAGREPTLRSDFLELITLARGDDARAVGVVTNGRRFAYAPFAHAAMKRGLRAAS